MEVTITHILGNITVKCSVFPDGDQKIAAFELEELASWVASYIPQGYTLGEACLRAVEDVVIEHARLVSVSRVTTLTGTCSKEETWRYFP